MSNPWRSINSVETEEGVLELRQRGEKDFLITIAGRVLMNSAANRSEIMLAELACQYANNQKSPRVLLGGLGMGYTLRAALDKLPLDSRVIIAELNPSVVTWCRGPLAHLTGAAVDDSRVKVMIADVATLIRETAVNGKTSRFNAIILDLYEGPFEAARKKNNHLYGTDALKMSNSALVPGGVFAVWSEDPDKAFERRLASAGFSVRRQRPPRGSHVVYLARKPG